jgi:hypothetical protein
MSKKPASGTWARQTLRLTSVFNTDKPTKGAASEATTPLLKLLDGIEFFNSDGSDKFYGMENVGVVV